MAYQIHVAGPAKILDTTALNIPQVEGQSFDLGNNVMVMSTSGSPYPTFSGIMSVRRRMSLSTNMIAAVLAKLTLKGLVLATGFEMYNQLVSAALRAAGSTHQKIAIATGLAVPRQLTVSQDSPARLSFDVIGFNAAGTTDPAAITESSALPVSAEISELFTLGPVKINGTAVEGVQGFTIDFGLRETIKKHSGSVYDQLVYLEMVAPRVSVRVDDAEELAGIGLTGKEQSATDSVLYLRKLDEGGTRVADATAEHVSFTIDEGLWVADNKGGEHPSALGTSISIQPTYDGTNDPIVLGSAVAIT